MKKVDIKDDNIRHCRCPICPVQSGSACAQSSLEKINNNTRIGDFDSTEATMLYCAIGKSTCNDLDGSESCMCPTCLVWNDYDLSSYHYCLKGDASEIN